MGTSSIIIKDHYCPQQISQFCIRKLELLHRNVGWGKAYLLLPFWTDIHICTAPRHVPSIKLSGMQHHKFNTWKIWSHQVTSNNLSLWKTPTNLKASLPSTNMFDGITEIIQLFSHILSSFPPFCWYNYPFCSLKLTSFNYSISFSLHLPQPICFTTASLRLVPFLSKIHLGTFNTFQ